jgi:hypothetical protein
LSQGGDGPRATPTLPRRQNRASTVCTTATEWGAQPPPSASGVVTPGGRGSASYARRPDYRASGVGRSGILVSVHNPKFDEAPSRPLHSVSQVRSGPSGQARSARATSESLSLWYVVLKGPFKGEGGTTPTHVANVTVRYLQVPNVDVPRPPPPTHPDVGTLGANVGGALVVVVVTDRDRI